MLAQGTKGMAKQNADAAATAAANPLVQQAAAKSIPRRVVEGAISEGFLEELPQSVSEQIFQNLALGKDWLTDVDSAAVMGVLSGGAMGGAASAFHGHQQPHVTEQDVQRTAQARQDAAQQEQQAKTQGLRAMQDAFAQQLAQASSAAPVLDTQALAAAGVTPAAPRPVLDTARIDSQLGEPIPTPAEAAAPSPAPVDPARAHIEQAAADGGSLSSAALAALDNGAVSAMQQAAADAHAAEQGSGNQKVEHKAQSQQALDPQTGEILQGNHMAGWSDAQLSDAFRGAQSRDVRMQLAKELSRRRTQREQQALQDELAAEQQGTVPGADRADATFASTTEDAGPVPVDLATPTPTTSPQGVNDGRQATQAQQDRAQPAQGAAAPADARPAPVAQGSAGAGSVAPAAGVANGSTQTANPGAQAAAAPGAATSAQSREVEALRQQLRDVEAQILQAAPAAMGQGGGDIEAAMRSRKVPVPLKAKRKKLADQLRAAQANEVRIVGPETGTPGALVEQGPAAVESAASAKNGDENRAPALSRKAQEAIKNVAIQGGDGGAVAAPEPAPTPKKPAPRGVLAKKAAAEEAARADYFTAGNIVKSYGGHDRVVAYQPAGADGRWSVTVRAVEKQGDAWVDKDHAQERTHATPPDARELKAGPVERAAQGAAAPAAPAAPTAQALSPSPAPAPAPSASAPAPAAPAAPADRITDFGEKIGGARKDQAISKGAKAARPRSADERPAWARRFEISQIAKSSRPGEEGRWVVRDTRSLDALNQPRRVGRETFATREEAEQAVPILAVAQKHRVLAVRGDGAGYEIWRDVSDRKRVKVVDQVFPTREQAVEYMAAHAQAIIETNTTFGEADLPRPPSELRTGAERRTRDARDSDFMEVFGFRGVEFGNWNNQQERQQLLNDAYDGLLDLAEVMGVPPRAISLNGDLALAFGARGHGLSSARAHYEPGKAVINLTKMNGAGSLAHEWFHALDHYFGRQDGKAPAQWVVGKDGTRSLEVRDAPEDNMASGGTRGERSGMRPELREAFADVMRTIARKAEAYVEDTARADRFVAASREEVKRRLDGMRADLARDLDARYYKRHNKAATAEQLAEFDSVAEKIVAGELLELRVESNESARSVASGIRWTNDALNRLSAVMKAVRGRQGFTADQDGPLDRLRGLMQNYSARLKILADAQGATEKSRAVPTAFVMNAKELDQGRGQDYWSRPHELAARAFQGYVEDKIAERGGHSPFLNYGPEAAAIATPWGFKRPFPVGEERAAINKALDKLVEVIQTREGPGGAVVLYSTSNGAAPARGLSLEEAQQAVQQALSGLRNPPPVDVVVRSEEAGVGAPDGVMGAAIPGEGRIVVVASAHGSADAVIETVFHEMFHLGVRNVLPAPDYVQAMLDLAKRDSRVQEYANRWKKEANDAPQQLQALREQGHTGSELTAQYEALAIEEGLAVVAEELRAQKRAGTRLGPRIGVLAQWLADVAERMGLQGLAERIRGMTYNEAERFVMRAIEHAGPAAGGGQDAVRFRTADTAAQSAEFNVDSFLKAMGDSAAFSEAAQRQAVGSVSATVDAIRAAWGANAPEVVVAFDMQDPRVPEAARKADLRQRSGGARGAPEGFYYRGKAYLMASRLNTPADAARVLYHEVLGHHGLRGKFGRELDQVLNQIATMRKAEVAAKMQEYGLRGVNGLSVREAAEEVLAEMAEKNPRLHFVQRAIAAIRNWLRANVPGFSKLRLTDNDIIQAYILPAREFVTRNGDAQEPTISRALVPTFSRTESTQATYESRIDALFSGGKAQTGTRILDSSDVMGLLGYPKVPLMLNESHLRDGLTNHPEMTAAAWKKVPGWIENPAAVYTDSRHPTRLTLIAPETLAGYPVVMVIESKPNPAGSKPAPVVPTESLLVTVYAKTAGGLPAAGYLASSGHLKYVDTKNAPEIWQRGGGQFPKQAALSQGRQKILTEKQLGGYKRAQGQKSAPEVQQSAGGQFPRQAADSQARREILAGTQPADTRDEAGHTPDGEGELPLFSRSKLQDIKASALDQIQQTLSHPGKVSLWDKTVGTMRHLAERSPAFKPVYEAAQRFIDDVSMLGNDAADRAPRLLPRVETLADLKKKPITAADNQAVAKPLFEGTLLWARDVDGKPILADDLTKKYTDLPAAEKAQILLRAGRIDAEVLRMWKGMPLAQFEAAVNSRFESKVLKPGVVWEAKELQNLFGLNDQQVSLYQEARAAIDRSIEMTARADMLRALGSSYAGMRDVVLEQGTLTDAMQLLTDTLQADAREHPDQAERLLGLNNAVVNSYERAQELQQAGYAPLSRFGRYTVDVVDAAGERQYFGMFETMREANMMRTRMESTFPGATVTAGTMSQEAFKLFQGITPESLEQFGSMLGLSNTGAEAKDKAFQAYLQLAKNNHSALKRLIHRKGISGYSEDVGRVLASFVYSNARLAAAGLNAGTLETAIEGIPKEQGELRDVAMGLRSYIQDPQEEGQAVRGMLFAQYLGGSVASALVNMTQPFQITMPWLSQFGGMRRAGAQLAAAVRDMARGGRGYEADLAQALRAAEDDGVVSPQEIHQLMAQARGAGALRTGDGTRAGDARAAVANNWERVKVAWGQPFALAEQINRRSTFIAAYRLAKEQGMDAPAEFARRAVVETQFVYSKANKPQWARGAIGGTLFTFKTYSVSYLELMQRMWTQGGPEGKRAVGWAVAMLLLMGGAGGLPFMEDAEDLIDGAGQLMGYNVSTKQWRKQALRDVVGKELGDFMEQGVSGLPGAPVDISGRLGMGNLVPGTGLLLTKQNRERDLLEIAGPAGDLVARGFTGARKALTGDVAGAAKEVSPTAVRNWVKGIDMAVSGIYKDAKGYKVIDTTLAEAIAKGIGFQPHTVAEVQESNSFMQRSKSFYIQTSSEIKAQWAQALFDKDEAALARVRERLADWNRQNPEQPIVVKMPDVWKRVREMGKDRTARIADTAPKALRQQMREMARENG